MNDIFASLRKWTQARIGLGLVGHSIPTHEVLNLRLAHAQARDAVLTPWDWSSLHKQLKTLGEEAWIVSTPLHTREEYLKRPDLGRQLDQKSSELLKQKMRKLKHSYDITFIASDGLSSTALHMHLLPLWEKIKEVLAPLSLHLSPLILAPFSRVALSDEIGNILHSKISVIIIGERPGLSSHDSLGIYLTYEPKPGKQDSERNCISNIRPPHGLDYLTTAKKLCYLLTESLRIQQSGIELKEKDLEELIPNIPKRK